MNNFIFVIALFNLIDMIIQDLEKSVSISGKIYL